MTERWVATGVDPSDPATVRLVFSDPMTARLVALREAVDQACVAAARVKSLFVPEAINWGDLRCTSAEHYQDDEGHVGLRVWVEEASSDASDLQLFIYRQLVTAGFDDVEVMTEW